MKLKDKGRVIKVTALVIVSISLAILLGIMITFFYAKRNIDFEKDERMLEQSLKWNSTTFYADSDTSDNVYTPIAVETTGSIKKEVYPLDEISRYVKEGFLAVEDRIFYEHRGIDVKRTLYAAANYITKRQKTFGASTITQQVIKNISGDNEISISRKLSEILRALNIEQKYSKDKIFEVYLNIIPMGENIYGVGLASRAYFGKEPGELNAAEAATLIGITNAPTAYNPYNNPTACIKKRNVVLSAMLDVGVITKSEYDASCQEPLNVRDKGMREDKYDSWFTETVISDVTRDLAEKMNISESAARLMLAGGGYSVYTTMDVDAQRILEKFFESKDNFPNEVADGLEFSMAITNARTGDLAAIAGRVGEKRANRILNHATVPHTPASTLKPLALYAPLIDSGKIRWSSVFDDVPQSFNESNGEYRPYPSNSPDVYSGLTTVSDAIRLSKNTIAVKLYGMRGAQRIYDDLISRYGISTLVKARKNDGRIITDLAPSPLALGQLCDGIPLIKMTECYGVFAADGVLRNLRSYIKVTDADGKAVLENKKEERRIYKESTARIMNKLLSEVVGSGTAKSVTLKNYVDTAGKTGTAGGSLEKMFIGYTPYYVGGIWCGYDGDRRAVTGSAHIAVWDSVMLDIHRAKLLGSTPEHFSDAGLVYRPYCMDSGELYSSNCLLDPRGSRVAYGYFSPDNAPRSLCQTHVLCKYDSDSKGVAGERCPKESLIDVSLLDIPDRCFPIEIYIEDAEFVYRGTKYAAEIEPGSDLPYFYPWLRDGEFAGISKRKKQFNSGCIMH